MPNLASAKKRVRQNERNRVRNRARKAAVKTEIRRFTDTLAGGDLIATRKVLVSVTKKLDQVAAAGALHRNTVSRRKSRLARQLNTALAAANA
jgi:small subunit ribosomal protein S20